ncbi:methyl-accepting chemotaxis protein [Litorilituus lipolyticus]|nr:methyl-accepting chemotaxis protein [Litorilituus lipolyticus]
MRASHFFKISSLAMAIFTLFFLYAMYWVGNSFAKSNATLKRYQNLQSLIVVDLNRTITHYLTTGDASLLVQANEQLSQIDTQSKRIEQPALQQALLESSSALSSILNGKLRALGKLSGNPLALLQLSEQSMNGITFQLMSYALNNEKISTQDKQSYLLITADIAKTLTALIQSRENLFNQAEVDGTNLRFHLKQIKGMANQLYTLPSLEIYLDDDEDELSIDDETRDELSQEAINELNSLIARYLSELNLTMQSKKQQVAGFSLLKTKLDALEETIALSEEKIVKQQAITHNRLENMIISLLCFLVIFLVTNSYLQHKLILNPLRLLRDKFVLLTTKGKVGSIDSINQHSELGEIANSFNRLVNQLSLQDQHKTKQLTLVTDTLSSMQNQANSIQSTSSSTSEQVNEVQKNMLALGQVTDEVDSLSEQVVENAISTQGAMQDSLQQVDSALKASEITSQAATSGKRAIEKLGSSVNSVNSIIDVINAIAEQTNLLALNAAIEAARAGEHGRGFSVVATEVRQLAGKTQDSLQQINAKLSQLHSDSRLITSTIEDIEQASLEQQKIAMLLKDNSEKVTEQAKLSATVAKNSQQQIIKQKEHYQAFKSAMTHVNNEVAQSKQLAENITKEVASQVESISQTLKVAS